MTLDERYESVVREPSDIQAHLPLLRILASESSRVVEFGVRTGISTVALLAGRPKWMRSYDIEPFAEADELRAMAPETDWQFIQADDMQIEPHPLVDLFFIDTLHTAGQLWVELPRHPRFASKIVLHATVLFGWKGENGERGLNFAIAEFLKWWPAWSVIYESVESCGLLILERK